MTHEDVNDILLEMANTRMDVEEEIYLEGQEPLIHDEEISAIPLEELIEELEQESGLEFNI